MLPSTYKTKVRFNQEIHGRRAGEEVNVRTSKDGILLDRQIRRRLKDNDGSVEIIKETSKPRSMKTEKTETKSSASKGLGSGKKEGDNVNHK